MQVGKPTSYSYHIHPANGHTMPQQVAQLFALRSAIRCELDEQRFFRTLRRSTKATQALYGWYLQQAFNLNG
jgi:hypothetical protein